MATYRKLPSGKFQAIVRLMGMKPLYATFPTKTKAKQWAKIVEEDTSIARRLTREELTVPQLVAVESTDGRLMVAVPTFRELVALYMEQYSGRDSGTQGKLDFWIKRFGDKRVIDINEFDVDDGLIALSRRPGRGNKTLTGSSINRYKSTLSGLFIWFNRHPDYKRLRYSNPVRQEHVSTFPENPAKDRFLTEIEQGKLLEAAKGGRWDRMYVLVLMALTTGCRKGELLGLTWADINLKCYQPPIKGRKANTVGVKEVSRLISRIRHRQFGVLVTTSVIARQAYEEVREDRHPVIFICGKDIADILITHGYNSSDLVKGFLDREFAVAVR